MWHFDNMLSSEWHGIGMTIWMLIVFVLAVLLVFGLVNKRSAPSSALIILSERYARGEISEEEYRKMKAEIGK
jgi:putative membrane protein